jgi:hypothetical protein
MRAPLTRQALHYSSAVYDIYVDRHVGPAKRL